MSLQGIDSLSTDLFRDYTLPSLSQFYQRAKDERVELKTECQEHFEGSLEPKKGGIDLKKFYQRKLKDKQRQLEQTIHSHRDIFIYEMRQKGEERLKNISYDDTIKLFMANQKALMNSKIVGNAFRLKGVHQSYFILNNPSYRSIKEMKTIVEDQLKNGKAPYLATYTVSKLHSLKSHLIEDEGKGVNNDSSMSALIKDNRKNELAATATDGFGVNTLAATATDGFGVNVEANPGKPVLNIVSDEDETL